MPLKLTTSDADFEARFAAFLAAALVAALALMLLQVSGAPAPFRQAPPIPLDRQLVGKWTLRIGDRNYDIDLGEIRRPEGGVPIVVRGGPGNDILNAAPGNDTVIQ